MAFVIFRDGLSGRWASMMITFCGLMLVLIATLNPYNFNFNETDSNFGNYFHILGPGKFTTWDIIQNILLFLSLGFGLTVCLMRTLRLAPLTSLAVTIIVNFGLSYTVEVLQMFLPSRVSSWSDVLSNCAGSILGFLCFLLWDTKFKIIDHNLVSTKNNFHVIILGFATFAFLISIPLQWESSLNNWDRTFPILLGNERTGDRPWQGYVSELYIADRALTETEVADGFSEKNSIASFRDSLLASYQFVGLGGYHDEMGNIPDLVWRGEPRDVQRGKGVLLGHNNWLETEAPAEYLTQRIVATSQFTLGITVATSDTKQTGPARIISLSKDPSHRNFTLGQEGSGLEFRLRTPLTGENGGEPRLKVPDVFSSKNLHNLIITYDGSIFRLYVDEVRNSHSLELNPGVIFFSSFFRLIEHSKMGYKVMHYAYYALIFIPLGILMAITIKIMKSRFVKKVFIICIDIMVPSLILEGILVIVSGKFVSLENLLISMIFTISPMVFFEVCYSTHSLKWYRIR